MPGWERTHSLWSSFSLGLVHYLLLDSEAKTWCQASQNHTQQLEFAESDLQKVDRAKTPWIVAVVHRPLYSSCSNVKEQKAMQDAFLDLFLRHEVDAVLNGHVHSYERTLPVTGGYNSTTNATVDVDACRKSSKRRSSKNDTNAATGTGTGTGTAIQPCDVYTNPKFPIHIVAGTAGNGESIDDCSKDAALYNWTFSAFRSNDIGYGSLHAHNRTHLEIGFFSVSQAKQVDHAWIRRTHDRNI